MPGRLPIRPGIRVGAKELRTAGHFVLPFRFGSRGRLSRLDLGTPGGVFESDDQNRFPAVDLHVFFLHPIPFLFTSAPRLFADMELAATVT